MTGFDHLANRGSCFFTFDLEFLFGNGGEAIIRVTDTFFQDFFNLNRDLIFDRGDLDMRFAQRGETKF
jgi:hypothetical protein